MKLARKLALAFLAAIVLALVAQGYARVHADIDLYEADIRRDHRAMGRTLLAGIREVWKLHGETSALQVLEEANGAFSTVQFRWIWLDDIASQTRQEQVRRSLASLAASPEGVVYLDGELDNTLYSYIRGDGIPSDRLGALEIAEPLTEEDSWTRRTIIHTILASLGVLVVCGLAAWGLGILLIGRRVDAMSAKLQRVARGDFEGPLEVKGHDELSDLERELNATCEQLSVEVSARHTMQDQLRHAERLNTVGKLASGIAHELGTPLNVAGARAKMIASGRVDAASVPDMARIIGEQCERMTRIIRQLLDFARSSRDGPPTPVDLDSVARKLATLVEPLAAKRGVRIETLPAERPVTVFGDEMQLQQVLSNLVLNAIQATPAGGVVSVGVDTVVLSSDGRPGGQGKHARVVVRDEGIGIEPEHLPHIFEPFFTTKGFGEGTGLGLSVAHGIVREHGGFIDVASKVGLGSTFTVHLPTEEREVSSSRISLPPVPPDQRRASWRFR